MCVCPDVTASSKIPIYTSEGPVIFISLSVLCCISISLRCLRSASQRWLQLRWNTLQAGSCVFLCVRLCVHECMWERERERDGGMIERTYYTCLPSDLWCCRFVSLKPAYFPVALPSVCSRDLWDASFTIVTGTGVFYSATVY